MINIVVLGPSNIAFRRTVPALLKSPLFNYIGVARASKEEWGNFADYQRIKKIEEEKCDEFVRSFGGMIFDSFASVLASNEIDAVYIPLPPSLHKKWALEAIKNKKHIILEKPFTTSKKDTQEIIEKAIENNLVVHENYAFIYHKQIQELKSILFNKELGELRFIRASFSFPYRGKDDFRYHKSLGGGSLVDCGGYPLRLVTYLLDNDCSIVCSNLFALREHDVDIYGSATLSNEKVCAQIFWGMDNAYKCNVELFGSIGFAYSDRVFSPTAEMETIINKVINGERTQMIIEPDDQFYKSIEFFGLCINGVQQENYDAIIKQAELIDLISKGVL